ncbi:MAG: aminopeptidase P family protein [Pseudomonadota bacterium]
MKTDEKIDQIRKLMKANGIDAIVVPSDDPHKSEYVAEHWQAGKWLTGFSGSAGIAVVTLEHAILWTDFRYYIQAEEQIQGSEFVLYKLGEPDVPGFDKWLTQTLTPHCTIGMDGALFSMGSVKKIKALFEDKSFKLDIGIDFIKQLWLDRPPMPASKAFLFSEKYAGESRADKILKIREKMESLGADYHLMVSLDDIAWTLNLRGNDVHTNPVNIAFLLFGPEHLDLFINTDKIDETVKKALKQDNIQMFKYSDIVDALSKIDGNKRVLINPENTSVYLGESINKKCRIIEKPSPVVALKAIKNQIQIAHIKETAVKDGIAMVNFLFWLEHQQSDELLTEVSAAQKLFEFRKEQPGFMDNSFDPIMAYQAHSAMCHYSATKQTNVTIGEDGIFLTDSGGNYLTGTTDITRTISRTTGRSIGSCGPSRQEIEDYTLVLKGHIAVATILFPKGTRGVQIDTLARQYLWKKGLDFGHGTGHGVGFFLCVHEGPARISSHPVDEALKKGMLLTNEPGIYREGQYGMRLENMILVQEAFENEFGKFLKFDQMTFCHFEKDLIDPDMMLEEEIFWLNTYHEQVYDKLSSGLKKETARWLKQKTSPL